MAEIGMRQRFANALAAGPRVWAIVVALVVGALVTSTLAWGFESPGGSARVALFLLPIAFFAVESFPIHVQFRSDATSFSLLELPLVLGVFFVDASTLILAVALGSTLALTLVRRQTFVKLLFNGANLVLQTALTVALFHWMSGGSELLGPEEAGAAMGASVAGSALSVTAIAAAIWASEGRLDPAKYINMVTFSVIVGIANASVALLAVVLIDDARWTLILLAIPLAVLFGSYRAFISERTQREQVEFLYSATKSLQTLDERSEGIATLVSEAASMFRSSRVDLLLLPGLETVDPAMRYSYGVMGDVSVVEIDSPGLLAVAASDVVTEATLVRDDGNGPARAYLDSLGVDEAMIGVLRAEQKVLGLLVVGDRVGTVGGFGAEDLRLFETLAFHAATALENDRLGQALQQLRSLESELSHQATHDTLTGLPNRLRLRQHLDRLMADGRTEVDLLFIDLDDFKLVNDTFGHASGDDLLHQVGERIQGRLGPNDVVARLGGDEFAVVVQPAGRGEETAKTIIDTVRAPITIGTNVVTVGCSIGLATASASTATSSLLRHADVAMYAAKNSGKGRLAHYSPELGEELAAQQKLQQRLHDAMDDGEFRVHYQPISDLAKDRIVGVEALVRWDTDDGLRGADSFLSVAEDSGFVTQIDRWVFAQVLRDIAELREACDLSIWHAVNLSARHLQEDDIVDFIISSVTTAGIHPSRLVLEITETAAMRDIDANIEKLERLAAVGFTIALDDFGTGFSSINHLRRLPVTMLKIAQPFVADLGVHGGETFIQAMIDLAHTLGLPVVGEGIERPDQLAGLRALGCDMGQGYLLARPLAFEVLKEKLIADSLADFTETVHRELAL